MRFSLLSGEEVFPPVILFFLLFFEIVIFRPGECCLDFAGIGRFPLFFPLRLSMTPSVTL